MVTAPYRECAHLPRWRHSFWFGAAERAAATTARRRAIAGNWCAGAGLDDDLIDIPGYRPQHGWKPATGTGVAPDIRPRARRRRGGRR